MKSIILIAIAVAADHFDAELGGMLTKFKQYRNWRWLHQMTAALEKSLGAMSIWNGPFGVLATALLPIAVTGFIYAFLSKPLFGLFGMLASVLILIYCMGPTDLLPQLRSLLDATRDGNASETTRIAQTLASGGESASTPVENALLAANERAFAPICWFAVLGWPGAMLYRIVSEQRATNGGSGGFAEGAHKLHAFLNWIPARLSALAYALSGNVSKGLKGWKFLDTIGLDGNDAAIKNVGNAAIETTGSDADQLSAVSAMLQKAMLIFIGLLLVLKIVAWMT